MISPKEDFYRSRHYRCELFYQNTLCLLRVIATFLVLPQIKV